MIQRIQTVYLFFVFCLMLILVFFPFSSSWMALLVTGLVGALAMITVFLYKKRRLQLKISYLILFLLILLYAFYFIFEGQILSFSEFFRQTGYTFLIPLVSCVLVYLAIRGIKKDEKLIRSLDRLR